MRTTKIRPTDRKLKFDGTPTSQTTPLRLFKGVWGTIRRTLLKDHGAVCMACGHAPEHACEIDAHEVYSFPSSRVIRLEQIALLCRKCHHVVHLERSVYQAGLRGRQEAVRSGIKVRRAEQAAEQGKTAYRAAMVEHYCKVNGVSPEQCEADLRQARPPGDWEIKVGAKATMDYGLYQGLIDSFQERKQQRPMLKWERAFGRKWDPALAVREWEKATGRKFDLESEVAHATAAGFVFEDPRDPPDPDDLLDPRHPDYDDDDRYEFLPDHECPEATAMWRDTFG